MSEDSIGGIFRILSAILWIGNLKFQDTESEACQLTREDGVVVKKVAKLLGITEARVQKVCTIRQINVRGTTTDIALKYSEVKCQLS
jgi:myosin heavy subunit